VIDHHPGHEAFWREKLGERAQIEVIGAACTLIYERWEKSGLLESMNPLTARMLAAGILDNTLNFTAAITTERDHEAYRNLVRFAGLSEDFAGQYFPEVQEDIEADLENAVRNDMKLITETDNLPKALGQIVVWDAEELLRKGKDRIALVMATLSDDWGVNIVDVSRGKTYFMAMNPKSQAKLARLFGAVFQDGISDPLNALLRKEIIKAALTIDKSPAPQK
jgi:inorganic pyrophosphatase